MTLPETNRTQKPLENRPGPERKRSCSNHPFSGAKKLVSGRVRCLNGFPYHSMLGDVTPENSEQNSLTFCLDLPKDTLVGTNRTTFPPNGGEKWCFTMVESVKNHQKSKQKLLRMENSRNCYTLTLLVATISSPRIVDEMK